MGGLCQKKFFSHVYQISNLNLLIIQILWFCQHTHAHLGCGGLLDRTPSQRIKGGRWKKKIILRSMRSYNMNSMWFYFTFVKYFNVILSGHSCCVGKYNILTKQKGWVLQLDFFWANRKVLKIFVSNAIENLRIFDTLMLLLWLLKLWVLSDCHATCVVCNSRITPEIMVI